ncbi:hypothetical protein SAMN02745148_02726 [Modicisalibacter ilicicola DSM 19980]|uniref:DUF7281 domain-containing protein n=1 Tax=Modicisalibacter ilicicola DSM 19980 TaxID=1121942 RepID=A0A1M5BXH9_9GAMM|nr:hypothetical protein [Halomonas ilicicola]SHF47116.1 hypothetical protein SAMN02745148_02726 [Halomonas ilicicola DSM 19980]
MNLSLRARHLLRDAGQALRGAPCLEKRRGKVVNEVVAWCQAHDIELGPRLSHARLQLDRDLLTRIDETLAALGEPAVATELSGLTTAEQARLGNREVKSVREKPRDQRVLASFPAAEPRPGLASRRRDFFDLDWRDLDLDAFDVLVQVENLDGFYAFEPTTLAPASRRRPLVLYRGDRHYGGAFARVAEAWAESARPHLYLGDFDAKGVSIALAGRATHLLLPPLEELAERANAMHLPPEQQSYQPALRDYAARLPVGHALADYLVVLLGEQRGLRQQWFGDPLQALPLGESGKACSWHQR